MKGSRVENPERLAQCVDAVVRSEEAVLDRIVGADRPVRGLHTDGIGEHASAIGNDDGIRAAPHHLEERVDLDGARIDRRVDHDVRRGAVEQSLVGNDALARVPTELVENFAQPARAVHGA